MNRPSAPSPSGLTPAELEDYEERVAIMVVCGGVELGEAERRALAGVLGKRGRR